MEDEFKKTEKMIDKIINNPFVNMFSGAIDYASKAKGLDILITPAIQSFKIQRLYTRLNEHEEKCTKIFKLCSDAIHANKGMEQFLEEKIFPIVLSDLIEEHEDAKINFILNGFENIAIETNPKESLIYAFYDILRSLRYEEVKLLFYYTYFYEGYKKPEKGFEQYIYNKLERLNLIQSRMTWDVLEMGAANIEDEQKQPHLTEFGKMFVGFISENFSEEDYEKNYKAKFEGIEEPPSIRNIDGGPF
jgi:hypothetical protein